MFDELRKQVSAYDAVCLERADLRAHSWAL